MEGHTTCNMKTNPAFPTFGDPNYNPNNLTNPYGNNTVDSSRGETYFNAPSSNSTMSSDNIEMVKRLHAFVATSSVKEGRTPQNDLGYANSAEEVNVGANYKSKYMN